MFVTIAKSKVIGQRVTQKGRKMKNLRKLERRLM
jgi:hypothetical protein